MSSRQRPIGITEMVLRAATGMERLGIEKCTDLEERSTVLTEAAAVHQGRTRGRIVEAEDHAERRRLAGAVRSEEPGHHAGMNLEAQIVDSDGLAEALGQSSDLDARGVGCHCSVPFGSAVRSVGLTGIAVRYNAPTWTAQVR